MATNAEHQRAWRERRDQELRQLRAGGDADPHRAVSRVLAAISVTALTGYRESPQQWIARNWPSWRPQGVEAEIIKTAVLPASTTGWGAETLETAVGPFLSGLAPQSAAVRLFARCVRLDFSGVYQINVPRASTSATPVFIAEGSPFPIKQDVFAAVTVGPVKKMMLGAAITGELEFYAAESATAIISRVMNDQAAKSLDAVVFDNVAAGATRPAGLLNGVSPITATAGGGLAALATDLRNIAGAIADAGGNADDILFIASPELAVSLRLLASAAFPYEIYSTNALAAGTIIGLSADAIASGYDGLPTIDISKEFTAHFEDTTPLAIGTSATPNTVAAPTRSGFQQNLLGLRLRLNCTWATLQPGCVQVVNSATW